MKADLLILGGRVWQRGASNPPATALAIADGVILAAGRDDEIRSLAGPRAQVLEAGGATITPGLADAHLHLVHWARAREELDLHGARSAAEVIDLVRGRQERDPGHGPLVGRGWDSNGWPDSPERSNLDAICPDRPVLLYSRDFHNLWVNGAALRRAGITRETPDPVGGTIVRDAAGEATGLLREHAMKRVAALEGMGGTGDRQRVRAAVDELRRLGITMVHDFEGMEAMRLLQAEAAEGRMRVLMHLPHSALEAAAGIGVESGLGDDRFRLGGVKVFADGTLGSRSAALLVPYDGTTGAGTDLISPEDLEEIAITARRAGIAIAIHAIGDRAVRSSLDAIEAATAEAPPPRIASRLEHVQLLDPADIPRFRALGVAASMQPSHCVSDIPLAERYWGSRRECTYPWRTLEKAGALLAFGSDAPVEPPDPGAGFRAAMTRRPHQGPAWVPAECLDVDSTLAAYTEGPARLAGSWPRLGTLAPGALADVVVWDRDLHGSDPGTLETLSARWVLMDGRIVHEGSCDRSPVAR